MKIISMLFIISDCFVPLLCYFTQEAWLGKTFLLSDELILTMYYLHASGAYYKYLRQF